MFGARSTMRRAIRCPSSSSSASAVNHEFTDVHGCKELMSAVLTNARRRTISRSLTIRVCAESNKEAQSCSQHLASVLSEQSS